MNQRQKDKIKFYMVQVTYYSYENLSIDWVNVHHFRTKSEAIKFISKEIVEPYKDIVEHFKEETELTTKHGYTYRLEEITL